MIECVKCYIIVFLKVDFAMAEKPLTNIGHFGSIDRTS